MIKRFIILVLLNRVYSKIITHKDDSKKPDQIYNPSIRNLDSISLPYNNHHVLRALEVVSNYITERYPISNHHFDSVGYVELTVEDVPNSHIRNSFFFERVIVSYTLGGFAGALECNGIVIRDFTPDEQPTADRVTFRCNPLQGNPPQRWNSQTVGSCLYRDPSTSRRFSI